MLNKLEIPNYLKTFGTFSNTTFLIPFSEPSGRKIMHPPPPPPGSPRPPKTGGAGGGAGTGPPVVSGRPLGFSRRPRKGEIFGVLRMPKYSLYKGYKNFAAPAAPQKYFCIPLFSSFCCILSKIGVLGAPPPSTAGRNFVRRPSAHFGQGLPCPIWPKSCYRTLPEEKP